MSLFNPSRPGLATATLLVVCIGHPEGARADQADQIDAFDPVLDAPMAPVQTERLPAHSRGPTGFVVGGGAMTYLGRVRSVLTSDESRLDLGMQGGLFITMGGRTPSPVELGLDVGFGLGLAYIPEDGRFRAAYDLLVEPRALWHVVERQEWSFYLGLAAANYIFDVDTDGVSEYAMGPFGVLGATIRPDRHGTWFIEASGGPAKNRLGFVRADPTPEVLLEDPDALGEKVYGQWVPIVRLAMGYRLGGF